MQIIPIDKQSIPYQTTIRLTDNSFIFTFLYNLQADLFTVNISTSKEILALGEPLIYGMPLFWTYFDERFPGVALIPIDPTGVSTRVGWAELGASVFLYIIAQEDIGQ